MDMVVRVESGMEVVDGMHVGHGQGIGRMSERFPTTR